MRYSWLPEEGERSITKEEALARSSDYLQQDVAERLGSAPPRPLRFRLQVQLASRADRVKGRIDNPVRVWPAKPNRIVPAGGGAERPRFLTAGVLELTRLVEGPAAGHDALGFNPLNLTRGIKPSADEILNFRHDVYELASAERMRPVPRPGPVSEPVSRQPALAAPSTPAQRSSRPPRVVMNGRSARGRYDGSC